jgi:hypothetical protein
MDNVEINRLLKAQHVRDPMVSIVIPCYNAEDYIIDCLRSALDQDYRNTEIIIVDDASTDRCRLLKSVGNVTVIRNETNLGECKTSAKGFDAAKGKYICRLSADDTFVNPTHISRQVDEMERYDLDWCYNSLNHMGESDLSAKPVQSKWFLTHHLDSVMLNFPNICYLIAGLRNPVNSSAMMIRAETYRTNRDISWDLGFRSVCDALLIANLLIKKKRVRAIPEIGSFYRIHPAQATGKPETNKVAEQVRCWIYDETQLPEYPFWLRACSRIIRSRIK